MAAIAASAAGLLIAWARHRNNQLLHQRPACTRYYKEPERDFIGYGEHPPDPCWPGGAKLAVNFVINFEEGSEMSVPDGDGFSEAGLTECGSDVPHGGRDLAAESMFEYGSRVGFWRIAREFERRRLPATVSACARALERAPEATSAMKRLGFDFLAHGLRWEEHFLLAPEEERKHIREAVSVLTRLTGKHPPGWYCRTAPSTATRAILAEMGGFMYDSDAYNDELPYWVDVDPEPSDAQRSTDNQKRMHLVIPYSLCTNDSKFGPGRAFSGADSYFEFMRDAFDVLRAEGGKMMSVGLHCRLIGHPSRFVGLRRFLDHVQQFDDVWVCCRDDIARHWTKHHPPATASTKSSTCVE